MVTHLPAALAPCLADRVRDGGRGTRGVPVVARGRAGGDAAAGVRRGARDACADAAAALFTVAQQKLAGWQRAAKQNVAHKGETAQSTAPAKLDKSLQ